jgi:hypothetical protein
MPTAIELNNGLSLQVGDGTVEAVRRFRLEGYSSQVLAVRAFDTTVTQTGGSGTVVIPAIGRPHPDFDGLFAYKYQLDTIEGGVEQWDLSFHYRAVSPTFQSTFALTNGPMQVGFQEVTARTITNFVDAYRANPTFPTNGEPTDADIGGEGVGRGTTPTSVLRRQLEIVVSITQIPPIDIKAFAEDTGVRCQSDLFGGLPGSAILYQGASLRSIGIDLFTVQHSYLYDNFFHLIQTPVLDSIGNPIRDEEGRHATVKFVQPFPADGPDPARHVLNL